MYLDGLYYLLYYHNHYSGILAYTYIPNYISRISVTWVAITIPLCMYIIIIIIIIIVIVIIITIIIRVHHVQKCTRAILLHAALCHS